MVSETKGQMFVPVWVDDGRVKVLVDDNGYLRVAVESITPSQDVHLYGWNGEQWQSLQMLWGYYDRYSERVTQTASQDGTISVYSTTVTAGEVWVVEAFHTYSRNRATNIEVWLRSGVDDYVLIALENNAAAWFGIRWAGRLTLKEGDRIRARHAGCLAGDVIEIGAWGYKMKVSG